MITSQPHLELGYWLLFDELFPVEILLIDVCNVEIYFIFEGMAL